ncbi:MAG TPA: hypothetical protein PLG36_03550 [Trueperaceae bacterium]|nr:hypothetical protein [Trueperaceae bacterium]
MVRFLELAGNAVAQTYRAARDWLLGLLAGLEGGPLDPRGWQLLTWLVVLGLLAVVVALLARARGRKRMRLPEMMISHGEVLLVGEPGTDYVAPGDGGLGAGLEAPPRAQHLLKLALSNLNPYPVQLIELAVRTRGSRLPVVAEAGAVVPPNAAVDVSADLFDLPGDEGVVELYLFSGRVKGRLFRLVAPLEWEPWDQRYRVKALEGRTVPARRLASQERRRRERRAFESSRRRERRKARARRAMERAESLKRQAEEYRVARAERSRVAGEAAEAAAAATRVAPERPARRTLVDVPGDASVKGPPLRQPNPPEEQGERHGGLRFPDEF